jgi:hypothetical protein
MFIYKGRFSGIRFFRNCAREGVLRFFRLYEYLSFRLWVRSPRKNNSSNNHGYAFDKCSYRNHDTSSPTGRIHGLIEQNLRLCSIE